MDVSGLPNSMTTVLCLCVHGGVPVRVVEYNSVSSCQIDSQTTRACRENETEYTIIMIESLQQELEEVEWECIKLEYIPVHILDNIIILALIKDHLFITNQTIIIYLQSLLNFWFWETENFVRNSHRVCSVLDGMAFK